MLPSILPRLRLRAVRGDIRYAESLVAHAEQQKRQIAAWRHDEEALVWRQCRAPTGARSRSSSD